MIPIMVEYLPRYHRSVIEGTRIIRFSHTNVSKIDIMNSIKIEIYKKTKTKGRDSPLPFLLRENIRLEPE
jgi:hypothetical protein